MDYLNKIKELYALKQEITDGFSETEVQKIESKLNHSLPETLRNYYLNLGANEAINYCYNFLRHPDDEIELIDGYFTIYEENQGVVIWGIKMADLSQNDPPVYANYDTAYESGWELEKAHVSDFLLMMAIYNGTFGGLRYFANCLDAIPASSVIAVENRWKLIPELSMDNQKIFTLDYMDVISLSFNADGDCQGAFVGTMDQGLFDDILNTLDIDWSYVSYEDEEDE